MTRCFFTQGDETGDCLTTLRMQQPSLDFSRPVVTVWTFKTHFLIGHMLVEFAIPQEYWTLHMRCSWGCCCILSVVKSGFVAHGMHVPTEPCVPFRTARYAMNDRASLGTTRSACAHLRVGVGTRPWGRRLGRSGRGSREVHARARAPPHARAPPVSTPENGDLAVCPVSTARRPRGL